MAINISGTLKTPQGSAIQNAEIIFEQTRTSTEVLAGTKFSVITNQTGNYSSSLGVGTYVFKVRFQDETAYRTVASNIIITPEMDGYSVNEIVITQQTLEDIDYDLLQEILQVKNEAVQASNQAKNSQQEAQQSAQNQQDSEQQSQSSQTSAKQSENAAKQSEDAASYSEDAAQQSQQQAFNSKNSAQASETIATEKAQQAQNSQQGALTSENQAQSSKQQALQSEHQQQDSQTQAGSSQQQAANSEATASLKASQASASQTNASNSQSTASTKAQDAQASQSAAQDSQTIATDKATQAQGSQSSASISQTTQTDKAQQSTSSAELAQKWAANPEDEEVSSGLFSAKHYAAKAAQYAQTTSGQLIWRGGWSAQTGAQPPTPQDNTQDFYRITQAGTILSVSYEVGDYIHWDTINSIWFKMDGTDSVTSVNGRTGAVVLNKSDVGLSQVNNWGASSQTNDSSTSTYATTAGVKAAYDLASTKLDINAPAVAATKLAVARTIGGVLFDGTAGIDLPGVNIQGNQSTSGNAASATKLATARFIGGVLFDGTADITLPGVNTAGTQNTSGNAATATKLVTARSINGTNFDGSSNITTQSWGAQRNITLGNTQKQIDGQSDIQWTVDEIGAAPSGFGLGDAQAFTVADMDGDPLAWNGGKMGWIRAISSSINKPDDQSGVGLLHRYQSGASSVVHILFFGHNNKMYTRYWSGTVWSVWKSSFDSTNKPTVSDVTGLSDALAESGGSPVLSAAWVQLRSAMWNGYVAADGQLLKRADYPDAWAAIEAGKVPVTGNDADWLNNPNFRGCFSPGDGSTTFRVPDYNGKYLGSMGAVFLRGDGLNSAGVAGHVQGDAIRNITGSIGLDARGGSFGASPTGAFKTGSARNTATGGLASVTGVDFDASQVVPTAADNHPVNVTGCWAVKLFGAVQNAGSIDAAGLATQLAEAQSRITELEKYPKVLKMSDIFEGTSVWAVNDHEFSVVEHEDYYHIQGIFRTISGGGAGGRLGSFKRNVKFGYVPCCVSQSPSTVREYAYLRRGWTTSAEYGKELELASTFISSSWVMASFMAIKQP